MLEKNQIDKIKEMAEEFFEKMTISVSEMLVSLSPSRKDFQNTQDLTGGDRDVVNLDIKAEEPQILIGQQGQTLFEIQHLLKMVLNKKLSFQQGDKGSSTLLGQGPFYFNLDINDYKKTKIEYLKKMAKDLADQVFLTKEEKALLPMSAYERRIIHSELSQRTDVSTESRGEGLNRHVVIILK